MNVRSAIHLMLTSLGIGLHFNKNAAPAHRGEARISKRFRSNQRQVRKDRRRAHAAGHRNAFGV